MLWPLDGRISYTFNDAYLLLPSLELRTLFLRGKLREHWSEVTEISKYRPLTNMQFEVGLLWNQQGLQRRNQVAYNVQLVAWHDSLLPYLLDNQSVPAPASTGEICESVIMLSKMFRHSK